MSRYQSYKDGANRDIREVLAQNENQAPTSSQSGPSTMSSFRQRMYEEGQNPRPGPSLFPPSQNRVNLSRPFNSNNKNNTFYNPGNRPLQAQNQNFNPRKFSQRNLGQN